MALRGSSLSSLFCFQVPANFGWAEGWIGAGAGALSVGGWEGSGPGPACARAGAAGQNNIVAPQLAKNIRSATDMHNLREIFIRLLSLHQISSVFLTFVPFAILT